MQKSFRRGTTRAQNIRNLCRSFPKQAGIYTDIPQNINNLRTDGLKRHTESPESKESMQKLPRTEGIYTEMA